MEAQVQLANLNPAVLLPPSADALLALAEAAADPCAPSPLDSEVPDPGLWALAFTLDPAGQPPPLDLLDQCLAMVPLRLADERRGAGSFQLARQAGQWAAHAAAALQLAPRPAAALALFSMIGELVMAQAELPIACSAAQLRRHLVRRWPWPDWLRRSLLQIDLPLLAVDQVGEERRRLLLIRALWRHLQLLWPEAQLPRCPDDGTEAPDFDFALLDRTGAPTAVPAPAFEPEQAALVERHLRLTRRLLARTPWRDPQPLPVVEAEAEGLRARVITLAQTHEADLRDQKLNALAEFAAGASHEINNPLAVISAQAQHLLRDEEDLERAEALQRIIAQCHRIHRVLRDVMLFARPPAPAWQPVRLDQTIKAIFTALGPLAQQRGVEMVAGPGLKQRLSADADLLHTALRCLVQNGLEASPRGGTVTVSASPAAGQMLAITVEDSGPGLSAELRRHGFDPFYSGRSAGRGLGMGLPKVWRVARLHDGQISVESSPSGSGRFVLTLPLRPMRGREALPGRAAARRSRPPRRRGKRA